MLAGYLSAQCHSRVTVSSPSLSSSSTYAMCALQFALLCLPAFCTQTILCFPALHTFCTLAFKCVATLFTHPLTQFAFCLLPIVGNPQLLSCQLLLHLQLRSIFQFDRFHNLYFLASREVMLVTDGFLNPSLI